MDATARCVDAQSLIVAVDLAKSVFQLCVADGHWQRLESHRLSRAQFQRWSLNRPVGLVIMEACGSAHHWGRWLASLGIEVQALQAQHRARSLWMGMRTAHINALRGFCREFGIAVACGARVGLEQMARVLADDTTPIPALLRPTLRAMLDQVRQLEVRIAAVERELAEAARLSPACVTLLSIPGIGLLTATAMVAATSGQVGHFADARHFAS